MALPVPGFTPATVKSIGAPPIGAPSLFLSVAVTVCSVPTGLVAVAGVRSSTAVTGVAPPTQLTSGFGTKPTTRLSRNTAES